VGKRGKRKTLTRVGERGKGEKGGGFSYGTKVWWEVVFFGGGQGGGNVRDFSLVKKAEGRHFVQVKTLWPPL